MKIKIITFILTLSISCIIGQDLYRGAEVRTRADYLYGKFEVRYKPAQGDGLVSSFFTYNTDYGNTPWNEIDIELLGRYEKVVDMNVITTTSHLRQHYNTFNPNLDFHTYGFEWTPDYVAWFIDEEEVYRQVEPHVEELSYPQKIMMNIWNPTYDDWVGVWDDRILPRFSFYDYVSYAEYTPGSGDIGTDSNFTLLWRDDFDSYDSTRWEKKDNHTWGGNQAIFIKENAVFQDGYLILCLTNLSEIGYQDLTIPSALWSRQYGNTVDIRFSEELDPISSQLVSNYSITNINILEALLNEDKRTVKLILESDEIIDAASMGVFNIADDSDTPNVLTWQVVSLNTSEPLGDSVYINNAGESFENFLEDQVWGADKEYGHLGGNYMFAAESDEISNTDQDHLYRSSLNRLAGYKIRVENGFYDLTLMLSENHYFEPNTRTFDIVIEDSLWINDLDVFAAVGSYYAIDLPLNNIKVEDGILDIYFSAQVYGAGYNAAGPFINGTKLIKTASLSTKNLTPQGYSLNQPYPNPFNPSISIPVDLEKRSNVTINIYNVEGRFIEKVASQSFDAGHHDFSWRPSNKSSGIYFIERIIDQKKYQNKVVFLK